MLYHVDFHIEYPASMSQKDFFSIWAREAEAALGAKKAGVVIDIWKCAGTRRVIAVANVDSLDTMALQGTGAEHIHVPMPEARETYLKVSTNTIVQWQ